MKSGCIEDGCKYKAYKPAGWCPNHMPECSVEECFNRAFHPDDEGICVYCTYALNNIVAKITTKYVNEDLPSLTYWVWQIVENEDDPDDIRYYTTEKVDNEFVWVMPVFVEHIEIIGTHGGSD